MPAKMSKTAARVTRNYAKMKKASAAARAAKVTAKAAGAGATGATAGTTAAATEKTLPFMKLLSTEGLWPAMKAHKFQSALGIFFLAQFILNYLKKQGGTYMGQSLQRQQIEGQMAQSPQDMYYQSMLPELAGERRGAQDALMQAILAGRGQSRSVPGELVI